MATVLSLSGVAGLVPTVNAAALTDAQVSAIISLLQSFGADATTIANVQSSLTGGAPATPATGTSSSSVPASLLSSSDLTVGSTGAAVKDLQKFLNAAGFTVASSGAGSMGNESTYFGNATKAALAKFQTAQGISPASGYFGSKTRAKLSAMGSAASGSTGTGSTGGTVSVPSGSGLVASLASIQPSGTLAPKNAARVPFTVVTLTAGSSDVTVNNITVERSGVAQDAAFDGVVLVDDSGMQIGDAKTLNSNHQANVGNAFVVKAGSSKTVTIAGNMASSLSSYDGQVASLKVVAVNTADSSSVSGLPLVGASLRLVNNITLGTVTTAVSSYDPNGAVSKEIGTTGLVFSGIRITAGSAEKVNLKSIRFNQSGSVSSSDLANVKVMLDGAAYNVSVDSTGKYYSTTFGNGILIDKGLSKDIYIQGDIVGSNASNRTIQFDIYKTTDIYMVGDTYGYGIIPSAGANTYDSTHATSQLTTSNPWFQSSAITVTAGSATTIAKALSVAAQNIAVNVPNQVLGGFDTDIKGEALSVQKMIFTVSSSSGSGTGLLTSVSLYQGNTVVAGPVDAVYASATTQTLTFTDTVTIPVGKTTYTLKGKVASGIGNNTQYVADTTPSGWTNVTGQTTGNAISLSTIGNFSMNTMTVKGAALDVSVGASPAAQTVVANRQNLTFANILLDASQSGEDVRTSLIKLYMTGSTTDVTSCQLFDGATALNTGSNVVTPTTNTITGKEINFTLDSALTVSKGTIKTLAVVCNLKPSLLAGNIYKWGINSVAANWTAVTGVTSGNTVSVTGTNNAGNAMTIGASALTVSKDSSSPSYALAYSGQSGVTMGVLKFHASSEAMTLKRVALKLTNPAASSSAADLVSVSLWDGASQVGSMVFTGSNTTGTTTLSTPVSIAADSDKLLTLKVDMASVGTGMAGHQGALIAVDINDADTTGTEADNTQSGGVSDATGTTAMAGVRLFRSVPTFAKLSGSISSFSGTLTGADLYRFSLSASPAGTAGNGIGLDALTIGVPTSTSSNTASTTVTNLKVYAYTDSAMNSPVAGYTNGLLNSSNAVAKLRSAGDNKVTLDSILQIPAGSTYYFRVIGDITFTPAAGSTVTDGFVSVKLESDSAYPSLPSLMADAATTSIAASNLIWSPNATTTSLSTHSDWTNGYLIPGLNDASMPTTTISKI